jgi:hypothetical protein
MDNVYNCSSPGSLKAQFYKRYYEILAVNKIKESNKINLSDYQILELFHLNENPSTHTDPAYIDSINKYIGILDSMMSQYLEGDYNKTKDLDVGLYNFYFGNNPLDEPYSRDEIFPTVHISSVKDYIVYLAFNVGQAGDFPHGNIYSFFDDYLSEGTMELETLAAKIEVRLERIFGENCRVTLTHKLEIQYVNSSYIVTMPIFRASDPPYCNSGFIQFTTENFSSFENLKYAENSCQNKPLKWIKY